MNANHDDWPDFWVIDFVTPETYRQAYAEHLRVMQAYADGNASAKDLRSSADLLKHMRAMRIIEREYREVRQS